MQPGGLRMSTQIVDAKTIAYRQIAEPPRRVVVDSRADERGQGAVGRADTQGSVPGTGQLHRRIDDSMQRHIQVQIGTDLDDDPHQLFHLVASCHQLVKLFVHPAHQLAPALPGERGVPPFVAHEYKPNRHASPAIRCR